MAESAYGSDKINAHWHFPLAPNSLGVSLFQSKLSKLLLLLVDNRHTARDHGIHHWCLSREHLNPLGHLLVVRSHNRIKLQQQGTEKTLPLRIRCLELPGQLVKGQVQQDILNGKRVVVHRKRGQ